MPSRQAGRGVVGRSRAEGRLRAAQAGADFRDRVETRRLLIAAHVLRHACRLRRAHGRTRRSGLAAEEHIAAYQHQAQQGQRAPGHAAALLRLLALGLRREGRICVAVSRGGSLLLAAFVAHGGAQHITGCRAGCAGGYGGADAGAGLGLSLSRRRRLRGRSHRACRRLLLVRTGGGRALHAGALAFT
ncbi:hypothetical protein JOS77_09795 [Chromobacterium haemolyticum]|nr:hypothetical protein JOS77_09795 [Chromobacterium haemolyticum]